LIARERDEAARPAWRAELAAVDPADLVFLDETAAPPPSRPAGRGRRGASGRSGACRAGTGPPSPGWRR